MGFTNVWMKKSHKEKRVTSNVEIEYLEYIEFIEMHIGYLLKKFTNWIFPQWKEVFFSGIDKNMEQTWKVLQL